LWNTHDLGYLTVQTAAQLARDAVRPGMTALNAGRLGQVEIRGSEVILGKPMIFNKSNIDQFDF
jgi:hypothetical protein